MSAAVLYAAKSTEDKHGSIPTQLEDGRKLAEREGLTVAGTYHDEAASAYRGNRGEYLALAMAHAERDGCALIVQHSDRLARGDGERSRHLVEIVLWARKAGVRLMSVQDPQTFDGMGLVYAALMGDRNHDDSARKSKATAAGLRRRADKGEPVGAMPFGHRIEDPDAKVSRRVVDPAACAHVEAIYEAIAQGATPGDVARQLNQRGVRTQRGGTWTARAVRKLVANPVYRGEKGYERIVGDDLFEKANANLRRLDPAAIQARRGGRYPREDAYLLRGVAFCICGAPAYTTRKYLGGKRAYVCRDKVQSVGLCNRPPVPAEMAEILVVNHLGTFVDGPVAEWMRMRAGERDSERAQREAALARERRALAEIERTVALAQDAYDDALGTDLAATALRQLSRLEARQEARRQAVRAAQAVLGEWVAPDLDAAQAYYERLVATIQGRIQSAREPADVNAALRSAIAKLTIQYDPGLDLLVVDFELRDEDGTAGVWLAPRRPHEPIAPNGLPEPDPKPAVTADFRIAIPRLEIARAREVRA
jgi:DNA invertase Pin-like site-specific DNA recombinase